MVSIKIKSELPIRTESEANNREHWRRKHARSKEQREMAKLAMMYHRFVVAHFPKITVTLTRIASRKLDSDNLARSFKAVRDGIAEAFDVDDGKDWYTWEYAQEKGKPKQYAVRIEIEGSK